MISTSNLLVGSCKKGWMLFVVPTVELDPRFPIDLNDKLRIEYEAE